MNFMYITYMEFKNSRIEKLHSIGRCVNDLRKNRTDITYKNAYALIQDNVKCSMNEYSQACTIYFSDLKSRRDILNSSILSKIDDLYEDHYENVDFISKETNISKKIIRAYIKYWLTNGKTLSQDAKEKFEILYRKFVCDELSSVAFSKEMFGTNAGAQIILLYMQNNNLIGREHYLKFKTGAFVRDIKFEITPEYINSIYKKQDGKSAIGGNHIRSYYRTRESTDDDVYSIDRIDNTRGYVEGNIQLITKHENMMKWILPQNKFNEIIASAFKVLYIKEYGIGADVHKIDVLIDKLKLNNKENVLNLRDIEFYDQTHAAQDIDMMRI